MRVFQSLAAVRVALAVPAHAGAIRAYDAATFHALQARNAPTIVFVHADWCPICRAQEKTISKLITTPEYRQVTVLTIDYDTQKALWTSFGAQKPAADLDGDHRLGPDLDHPPKRDPASRARTRR